MTDQLKLERKLSKLKKRGFRTQCTLWGSFAAYLILHFIVVYTSLSEAWDVMGFVINIIILAWLFGYWKGLDDNE